MICIRIHKYRESETNGARGARGGKLSRSASRSLYKKGGSVLVCTYIYEYIYTCVCICILINTERGFNPIYIYIYI